MKLFRTYINDDHVVTSESLGVALAHLSHIGVPDYLLPSLGCRYIKMPIEITFEDMQIKIEMEK